jgi:N-acetyl-anhydromuramyl-L-alanine amidase AmpD
LIAPKALLSGAVLVLIVWVFSGNRLQQVSTSSSSPKARETIDGTGVNGNVPNSYQTSLDPGGNKKTRLGSNHGQNNSQATLLCLTNHPEIRSLADPSNYGPRLAFDWQMRPVANRPTLIVLHETVVDESTAMALFRSPHNNNSNQSSYHILIRRDGRRIRLVPDSERAYGAGDSDFAGMAVQLKPGLPPSLNNIALHVSLVSPPDGADGELREHSGYTEAQYSSLASQIARWKLLYGIPPGLVLTHQEVDRSGSRRDPRSFNWGQLSEELRSHLVACGGSPITAALGRSGSRSQLTMLRHHMR